jgi:hypothetical protein
MCIYSEFEEKIHIEKLPDVQKCTPKSKLKTFESPEHFGCCFFPHTGHRKKVKTKLIHYFFKNLFIFLYLSQSVKFLVKKLIITLFTFGLWTVKMIF